MRWRRAGAPPPSASALRRWSRHTLVEQVDDEYDEARYGDKPSNAMTSQSRGQPASGRETGVQAVIVASMARMPASGRRQTLNSTWDVGEERRRNKD